LSLEKQITKRIFKIIFNMKKILSFVILLVTFISFHANAETMKIAEGLTVHCYGNRFVVDDAKSQRCFEIVIEQNTNSVGDAVYEILCQDEITRGITQLALSTTIQVTLSPYLTPWGTAIVNTVANGIYSKACKYYGKKRN